MSLSPIISEDSPELKISDVCLNLETQLMDDFSKANDMQVFVRVRPMLNSEIKAGYKECLETVDEQTLRAIVPASSVKYKNKSYASQDVIEDFKFTTTFGPEVGQLVFFERSMMNTLQSFIEGQNNLVFSYGTTGSGKTFTLQGDAVDPGIIPLSLHLLFASIEDQLLDRIVKSNKVNEVYMLSDNEIKEHHQLLEKLLLKNDEEEKSVENLNAILCKTFSDKFENEVESTLSPKDMALSQAAALMKEMAIKSAQQQTGYCNVWLSFVEVYNECVYDLLQPLADEKTELILDEDENGEVYLKGLREICVFNSNDALKLLNLGQKNLRTASTELNHQSGRSHCIFSIKVVRIPDPDNITNAKVSRLSFCDLADSERTVKSETTGVHLEKTGCANTLLDVLGRCLEQLHLNSSLKDKKQIPSQESRSTHLLSKFFTGRSKKVMITNASPSEFTLDETLHALRFSALGTELNVNDSYIATASTTLQTITNTWTSARANISSVSDKSIDFDDSYTEVLQEKDELIEKLVDLAESLTNNLSKEKKEKIELERKIRRDICEEYSQFCEELLENERKSYEEKEEAVIRTYQERITEMELMYEDVIKKYEMQTEQKDSVPEGHISMASDSLENNDTDRRSVGAVMSFEERISESNFKEEETNKEGENFLPRTEELLQNLNILNCDIDSLSEELRKTKEELQKSKDYCSSLENVNEELEKKIEAALVENDELKAKIDLLSSNQDIVDSEKDSSYQPVDKTEYEALKETLELLKSELDALKIDCVSYKVDNDDLFKKKVILEEKLKSLSEELESAKLENQNMHQKVTYSERHIADLKEEVKKLLEKITDLVKLQDESDAEHRISLEKSERRAKEAEIVLESINQTLSNALIVTEEQKMKLESFEAESAEFKDRIAEIQEENKELKEKYDVVSKELEIKKTVYEQKLDVVRSELEQALLNAEKQKATIEQLVMNKNPYEKEISELKMSKKELEDHLSFITAQNETEIMAYQKELDAANGKLTEALSSLDKQKQEIENLENIIDADKGEIAKLLKENEELLLRINVHESEKLAYEEELDTLNTKLAESLCALDKQKLEVQNLKNVTDSDRIKIAELLEQNEKLQENDSSNIGSDKEALEEELSSVNSKLAEALCTLDKQNQEMENLRNKIESYENKTADLKKQNEELKEKLNLEIESEKALEVDLDRVKTNLTEALSTLDEQIQEIESLKSVTVSDSNKIAELLKQNEELQENFNLKIGSENALKMEIETANSELAKASSTLDEQIKKIESLKSVTVADSNKIAELLKQNEELQENFNLKIGSENALKMELETANSELAKASSTLDRQIQEIESLKTVTVADSNKIAELLKQNEELQEKFNLKLESENSLKMELETANYELAKTLSTLLKQNQEMENFRNMADSDKNKIAKLQKENDDLLKNSNSDIESEKEALKAELDTVNSKLAERLCAFEKQNLTVENLRNEVNSRESKLAELQQQNEELQQKLNSETESDGGPFKKELNNVNSKLTEALLTLDKQNKEVESLKSVINSDQKLIAELQKQNEELQEKLNSETERRDNLLKIIQILQKCEYFATSKTKDLHTSSIKHLEQIMDLKKCINQKEGSIDKLENDCNQLQKNLMDSQSTAKKQFQTEKQLKAEIDSVLKAKINLEKNNKDLVHHIVQLKSKLAQKEASDIKCKKTNDKSHTPQKEQNKENIDEQEKSSKKIIDDKKTSKEATKGEEQISLDNSRDSSKKLSPEIKTTKRAKKEPEQQITDKPRNSTEKSSTKKSSKKEKDKQEHEIDSSVDSGKKSSAKKTAKKGKKGQEQISLDNSRDASKKLSPDIKTTKRAKKEQEQQITDKPRNSIEKSSAKKSSKKEKSEVEQQNINDSKEKMSVEGKASKVKDNRKKKSDENSGHNAENKKPKTEIYEEVDENNDYKNKKKLKSTTRRQLRNVENVTPLKSQNMVNDSKTKGPKRKEVNDSPENKLSEKNVLKKIKLENVENIPKPVNPRVLLLKVNIGTDNIAMPSPRMTRGRKKRLCNTKENISQNKENSRRVRS